MDEFSRIETFFAPLAAEAGLNLKDDAAVLAPPPGRELVFTVDQMLEAVHFFSDDDPALIARKLLRRNLSDLAAMGAVPLGYLLTTALPKRVDEAWLEAFAKGLGQDQAEFGIGLLGGDSSSARTDIALSATLIGHVAPGQALRRSGARAGDGIFVTGTIGDAVLGLEVRRGKLADPTGFLRRRSELPAPRVGLALAGIVNAAIDISDGLVQDLGHLCRAAGLQATINAQQVPASAEAAALGDAVLEQRLTGGDDYELLLAVAPENEAALRAACGAVPVTRIGSFQPGEGVVVLDADGEPMALSGAGWKHF
ncbi:MULTISPECIES: thiamine-phosphate kinase [unclassified Acidocella]|uniref:thiamine-phosphate kinase n=1 Tax=unclassified Acidocella TaxID=2648610 RepID=UPI00028D1ACF|nr:MULTISPECIES: thiamine-phosphate kinase [unclassified Acidocella]EKN00468.1 thiamine-monophosphate kinase [Acidocella sp. MX-AZ02]WBO60027.1 thiamine-phosphate kinase [Acidocella sp. MX-AZ03]